MPVEVSGPGRAFHLTILRDPANADNRRLFAEFLYPRARREDQARLKLLEQPIGFWRVQRKMLQNPLPFLTILDPIAWKLFWHPLLGVQLPSSLTGDQRGAGGPLGGRVYPVKPLYLADTFDVLDCQHPGCKTAGMPNQTIAQRRYKLMISSPGTGWKWVCQDCLKAYSSRRDVPQRAGVPLER